MWFCTNEGLVKYDGNQLKFFKNNKKDSTSLSSSWVFAGLEDSKRRFWIGTGNGLNLMDRRTQQFQRFYHVIENQTSLIHNGVRDIFEDSQNRIWIGTIEGICLFDESKQSFIRLDTPSFLGGRYSPKFMEDSRNNIWVTSSNGLYKIDSKNVSIEKVQFLNIKQVHDGPVDLNSTWEDRQGDIWITTKDQGIWIYKPNEQKVFQLDLPKDIRNDTYSAIVEYPKGFLMIGSLNEGLISWDLAGHQVHRRYSRNPLDYDGLIVNSTYSLATDRFANLWIGTFNGINKTNLKAEKFHLYQNNPGSESLQNYILRINEDRNGGIWTNTMRGVFYRKNLNAAPESFIAPPINENQYSGIRFFYLDEQNKLWLAMRNYGLYVFNSPKGQLHDFIDLGQQNYNDYPYVLGDNQNSDLIWYTSQRGLFRYNKKTASGQWFTHDGFNQGISTDGLGHFLEDASGNLWIALNSGGLAKFDKRNEQFHYLTNNPSDSLTILPGLVTNMSITTEGLWVSTQDGLSFLKNGAQHFFNYPQSDSLFQYGIAAMETDDKGNVWIADNNGISIFEPKTRNFHSYYCMEKTHGFTNGGGYKGKDGRIFFSAIKGILTFHPDSIKLDLVAPRAVLTGFKINNEAVNFGEAEEFVDTIFLTANDKVITFEYSALHFYKPQRNQFRIMLEGFDKDWRNVGQKKDATYTNLRSGEYTFKVLSANSDGIWADIPLSVKLFIRPPYWQSNWFYTLICLVLSSIAYMVYRSRQHTQKLAEAKKAAENSALYKTRFLANMSHEIRTPMNAIVGMSKLILDTNLNEKQNEYAKIVQQSAENLLVIINDILDQSKIESGHYSYQNRGFELDIILNQLHHIFSFRAIEKKLDFDIVIGPDVPRRLIGDATRLNQILMNLLGNAFKFTEKGRVRLSVSVKETSKNGVTILFCVKDSGIGIKKENHEKIFESFRQIQNEQSVIIQGAGLGLSISRQLVEDQGGTLWVESEEGNGSIFYFTLLFALDVTGEQSDKNQPATSIITDPFKFLIAEDTLFNQMLTVELLKKSFPNAQIDLADNGKVALEKISIKNYDLVLMDVKMPVMDGLEATQLIRKHENKEKRAIPILAVTANAIPEQLESCKLAGMNDYISKPINSDELLDKIVKYLKKGTE